MNELKLTPDQIRKQKIEWAEDYITHAKTGIDMPCWEYSDPWGDWELLNDDEDNSVLFILDHFPCRRKDDKK